MVGVPAFSRDIHTCAVAESGLNAWALFAPALLFVLFLVLQKDAPGVEKQGPSKKISRFVGFNEIAAEMRGGGPLNKELTC